MSLRTGFPAMTQQQHPDAWNQPYSSDPLSSAGGLSGRENIEALKLFQGVPRTPYAVDVNDNYPIETKDYPYGFDGEQFFLRETAITFITYAQLKETRVIAPVVLGPPGKLAIAWDRVIFDDAHLGPQPYQTAPRVVTSRVSSGRANFKRWGLGARLEADYASIPAGHETFRGNFTQLTSATATTMGCGVVTELMSLGQMPSHLYRESHLAGRDRFETQIRKLVSEWAIINKDPGKATNLVQRNSSELKEVSGVEGDVWYIPSGTLRLIGKGLQEIAGPREIMVLPKVLDENFQREYLKYAHSGKLLIVESTAWPMAVDQPKQDPTKSIRRTLGYFMTPHPDAELDPISMVGGITINVPGSTDGVSGSINLSSHSESRADTEVWSEPADNYERVRWWDAYLHSGLFYRDAPGEPPNSRRPHGTLSDIGRKVTKGHTSIGEWLDAFPASRGLIRWVNALSANQAAATELFSRFGGKLRLDDINVDPATIPGAQLREFFRIPPTSGTPTTTPVVPISTPPGGGGGGGGGGGASGASALIPKVAQYIQAAYARTSVLSGDPLHISKILKWLKPFSSHAIKYTKNPIDQTVIQGTVDDLENATSANYLDLLSKCLIALGCNREQSDGKVIANPNTAVILLTPKATLGTPAPSLTSGSVSSPSNDSITLDNVPDDKSLVNGSEINALKGIFITKSSASLVDKKTYTDFVGALRAKAVGKVQSALSGLLLAQLNAAHDTISVTLWEAVTKIKLSELGGQLQTLDSIMNYQAVSGGFRVRQQAYVRESGGGEYKEREIHDKYYSSVFSRFSQLYEMFQEQCIAILSRRVTSGTPRDTSEVTPMTYVVAMKIIEYAMIEMERNGVSAFAIHNSISMALTALYRNVAGGLHQFQAIANEPGVKSNLSNVTVYTVSMAKSLLNLRIRVAAARKKLRGELKTQAEQKIPTVPGINSDVMFLAEDDMWKAPAGTTFKIPEKPDVTLIRALLFSIDICHDIVEFGYKHGLHPPFYFLCWRIKAYRMGTGAHLAGYGAAMLTFMGQTNVMITAGGMRKDIFINLTTHFKTVTIKREMIMHNPNMMCDGYYGGCGTRFYDPLIPEHVAAFRNHCSDNVPYRDIIVVCLGPGEKIRQNNLDLLGRYNPKYAPVTDDDELQYSTAGIYGPHWGWTEAHGDPNANPFEGFDLWDPVACSIPTLGLSDNCRVAGAVGVLSSSGSELNKEILGASHFGVDYPGVAQTRIRGSMTGVRPNVDTWGRSRS
jgi:hypothetical protein